MRERPFLFKMFDLILDSINLILDSINLLKVLRN